MEMTAINSTYMGAYQVCWTHLFETFNLAMKLLTKQEPISLDELTIQERPHLSVGYVITGSFVHYEIYRNTLILLSGDCSSYRTRCTGWQYW